MPYFSMISCRGIDVQLLDEKILHGYDRFLRYYRTQFDRPNSNFGFQAELARQHDSSNTKLTQMMVEVFVHQVVPFNSTEPAERNLRFPFKMRTSFGCQLLQECY